jgi:DnaJ-domain-containing protein 1
MLYLLAGGAALALYVWLTGGKWPRLSGGGWRVLTGAMALAAFTSAGYAGVRGSWGVAIVLGVVGLWLAASTRRPAPTGARPAEKGMSPEEARRVLGVGPEAGESEIREAYKRLMRAVHPDRGGSAGLAAQLNAARDRLLKRR